MIQGYKNKDQYTSPEQLIQKGAVSKDLNQAHDVYSFAIVLWQILHQKYPFENLEFDEMKELVVQASRPKIEYNVPTELGNLIRECWHSNKEKRPTF